MSKLDPRFVLRRPSGRAERAALQVGKPIRERNYCFGHALYIPVRVKPRFWTSQVLGASVIHIATGRGVRVEGSIGTHGWVYVEPYCYASLEWPRALSSPADFPERRLCSVCLVKAHAAELSAA